MLIAPQVAKELFATLIAVQFFSSLERNATQIDLLTSTWRLLFSGVSKTRGRGILFFKRMLFQG